jgi:hypothetical protein
MEGRDPMKTIVGVGFGGVVIATLATTFAACIDPPPKIAAIPQGGIAFRLYVFGAQAQEARQAFDSAKQTNKNLKVVREGGDGEVVIGLEEDSPKCVQPTAICSYKVAVRIRDNQGKTVFASTLNATANSERCADLCDKALNVVVVKVVETAVASLNLRGANDEAGVSAETGDGGADTTTAAADASTSPVASSAPTKPPAKKAGGKAAAKPEASPKEPPICVVGHGPKLAAEEAEKRAAQVEALKRLNVLDQEEYDCLRKAYLDRL